MSIQSINPYTLEKLKSFDEMTESQIEKAITKAHETYQSWKFTSYDRKSKGFKQSCFNLLKKRKPSYQN